LIKRGRRNLGEFDQLLTVQKTHDLPED